jgi:hypothetical protein
MNGGWGAGPPPDPELDQVLGDDPELLRLASVARAGRPEPELDPRFRAVLRARLMREAATALAPGRLGLRHRGPRPAVWAGIAAVTACAVAAAGFLVYRAGVSPPPLGGLAVVSTNVSHDPIVDPTQAITVSFNQPMDTADETAVGTALVIRPATAFTVAWHGSSTLVVTPVHPLAANTDYQVLIPASAVRSQSGQTLPSAVTLSFGTQATPTPSPSPGPLLTPVTVAPVGATAAAFWEAAAIPGVTASTAAQPVAAPSPTPTSGGATPSASASPTATPSLPSSAPPVAAGEGAAVFPAGQAPLVLSSSPASAAAMSPNSLYVALALPGPDGSSTIVVENLQSADPPSTAQRLWPEPGSPGAEVTALAWQGSYRIVFVTASGIQAVNLEGQASVLEQFAGSASTGGVVLSADGRHAFVPAADAPASGPTAAATPQASPTPAAPTPASTPTPSAAPPGDAVASPSPSSPAPTPTPGATGPPAASSDDGWLVTLPETGGSGLGATRLAGSAGGVVAFSGDGQKVVWTQGTGDAGQALVEAPVSAAGTPVPVPLAGLSGVDGMALSPDGGEIAIDTASGVEVISPTEPSWPTSPAATCWWRRSPRRPPPRRRRHARARSPCSASSSPPRSPGRRRRWPP